LSFSSSWNHHSKTGLRQVLPVQTIPILTLCTRIHFFDGRRQTVCRDNADNHSVAIISRPNGKVSDLPCNAISKQLPILFNPILNLQEALDESFVRLLKCSNVGRPL
jgi:hypothetical protein